MIFKTKLNRLERRSLYLGSAITAVIMLFWLAGIGESLSNRSLDMLFWWRGPIEPAVPVVIVAIDNESFNEMPERWVWPRDFHGKLVDKIMKGKPKAIAFDVLFTEPTAHDPRQDADFAAACRRSGCVILGAELVQVRDKQFEYQEFKLPTKVLFSSIYSSGVVNTPKDSDGFVRRSRLMWRVNEERHYSLALEALRKYSGVGKGEINYEKGWLEFGDRRIPLDNDDNMLINYCGPAKSFKTIPYYQVFKGMTDPAVFRDAIVFVGASAESLHDTFHTPTTFEMVTGENVSTVMPGVEIHANVIDTILTKRFLSYRPWTAGFLQVILGMLISIVVIRAKIWVTLLTTIAAGAGLLGYTWYLFAYRLEFIEYLYPLGTLVISFLACTTWRASLEMREKQRVRGTFARYVSPHVLTAILTKPPELGGARRVASILFSDVRGFTSMSEKLTAHEVVEILNEYLTEMVGEVLAHDGTLDKFVGDAVMAVFGSPMDQPDHALRAVSTAWEMGRKHEALKEKWVREGKVPFEIGIGVNTGEVVAGNMGSPQRMEFTVIGDNVNLAARMESATKDAGCKILLSESTYLLVKDHVQVKEREPVHMKGKADLIKIFELQGFDESVAARLRVAPATKS